MILGGDRIELRKADVDECFLGGWASPEAALEFSVSHSTLSYRIALNGEVLCYWGFAAETALSASCKAWMLSAPAIEKHRVFAARESRRLLDLLLEDFYAVAVLVDPNYETAVRWLSWLGFRRSQVFDRFVEMRVTRGSRA